MINKKVINEKGQEFTLIQFVVQDNKVKAILETQDGKFLTEDYFKIKLVK
jgi:hypothetical protein